MCCRNVFVVHDAGIMAHMDVVDVVAVVIGVNVVIDAVVPKLSSTGTRLVPTWRWCRFIVAELTLRCTRTRSCQAASDSTVKAACLVNKWASQSCM